MHVTDAGIFVASVQAGSAADGKLFPGDKILAVCKNKSKRRRF